MDSNKRPRDYESPALTAELRALKRAHFRRFLLFSASRGSLPKCRLIPVLTPKPLTLLPKGGMPKFTTQLNPAKPRPVSCFFHMRPVDVSRWSKLLNSTLSVCGHAWLEVRSSRHLRRGRRPLPSPHRLRFPIVVVLAGWGPSPSGLPLITSGPPRVMLPMRVALALDSATVRWPPRPV